MLDYHESDGAINNVDIVYSEKEYSEDKSSS